MRCKHCGRRVDDNVAICSRCGRIVDKEQLFKNENSQIKDSGSVLCIVLGLIFPIAGFILYFCWKKQKPLCARQARMGALITSFSIIIIFVAYLAIKYGIFSKKSYSVSKIVKLFAK